MEKRYKVRYNTEEALQYIIDPGSDSELSDFEDDDGEDLDSSKNLAFTNRGHISSFEAISKEVLECNDIAGEPMGHSGIDDQVDSRKNYKEESHTSIDAKKHSYRWRNRKPPKTDATFTGPQFSLPPENFDKLTPFWYFKHFWDDSMTQQLVDQTNLYSVQKTGTSINTKKSEIEQLIGMQLKMGIVQMPKYNSYWAGETRYSAIADVMPLNRYRKLRQFLHVNDNSKKDNPENRYNKLYKIEPILKSLRENCQKLEQEEFQAIDEQIVPAKTKFSGMRQYNPRKPHKWGFKNFVRAGESGMIYDFFFYTGATTAGGEKTSARKVVLELCNSMLSGCNYKLFYDNWFTTLDLCLDLKEKGILTTATIRSNRLSGCILKNEAEMRKDGRGSSTFQTDQNTGMVVLRWYDNKCVTLVSTYLSVDESVLVKRWNSAAKSYVDVTCPIIVKAYNTSMGGVDLADMLIALYRCKIKTKRWYLVLLFHAVDIAKVNAWLLYRRFCSQMNVPVKKQLSLLDFVAQLSEGLINTGKLGRSKQAVGRPKKRSSQQLPEQQPKRGRAPKTLLPDVDSRYDQLGHWACYDGKKNRCRLCKVGYSRISCEKCKVSLCLTSERNCFRNFHTL